MSNAVIYSENPRAAAVFTDLLTELGYRDVLCLETIAFSHANRSAALHIINSGADSDCACRLAKKLAEVGSAAVLLVTEQNTPEEALSLLRASGVLTVEKPLSRQLFVQAVRDAESLCGKLNRISAQMEEQRRISRAKLLLVSKNGMTEPEAHKHIEKQAMNRRITRLEVADELIDALKD